MNTVKTGAYRIHNICVRRFDIIFAGLSCWISIQTYWNINNYSYSYFYQKKVINQGFCNKKNATRHTTYLLSPQKKVLPFFHLNFSVPKKNDFPHIHPLGSPSQRRSRANLPKMEVKTPGPSKRIREPPFENIAYQKNWRWRYTFLVFLFHPSVCDVSRLLGKKDNLNLGWGWIHLHHSEMSVKNYTHKNRVCFFLPQNHVATRNSSDEMVSLFQSEETSSWTVAAWEIDFKSAHTSQ